jgi:phage baseplate assembly protein gpV
MTRNPIGGVWTGYVREIDEANSAVRLEFPNLPEAYRSHWAPIAHGMSGRNRGMYFLPEEGDEALVAFLSGNFDNPYVLGFLWNGAAMPPESDRNNRVILTPGGHTLRFEDTEGAGRVVLESSGGHSVTIDDVDNTVTVSDSTGANQVVIDAGGTVTVMAKNEVVLDAPSISLSPGAAHPVPFGDLLRDYLNTMVDLLKSHTHLVLGVLPAVPSVELQALVPYEESNNSSIANTG